MNLERKDYFNFRISTHPRKGLILKNKTIIPGRGGPQVFTCIHPLSSAPNLVIDALSLLPRAPSTARNVQVRDNGLSEWRL